MQKHHIKNYAGLAICRRAHIWQFVICLFITPSLKWFYFDWDTNPGVNLISNLNEIFSHCISSSEFDFAIYFRVLSVVSDSIGYSLNQISCMPCITGASKVADNTRSSLCTHWLNLLNSSTLVFLALIVNKCKGAYRHTLCSATSLIGLLIL